MVVVDSGTSTDGRAGSYPGTGGADAGAGGAGGTTPGKKDATPPDATGAGGRDGGVDASDAGPACKLSPQLLVDWCRELPELAATPIIDGELECGLETRVIAPDSYSLTSTPDSTIAYALAWTTDGLYFFASVQDPAVLPAPAGDPVWMGDSVELYVDSDGSYASPPKYDPDSAQIIIAAPSDGMRTVRAELYAVPPTGVPWTSTRFASFPTPDGYVVEAVVSAADLGLPAWALAPGAHVGFDIGLNVSGATPDAGTQGTRIGQFFLRVDATLAPAGHPFQSVTAFCNPILVAR